MKPIVIIAIAVVCSVVAVLGVLVVVQQMTTIQTVQDNEKNEQEYLKKIEHQETLEAESLEFLDSKNREICVGLFGNQMEYDPYSVEIHIYTFCLKNGYETAINRATNDCNDLSEYSKSCELSIQYDFLNIIKTFDGASLYLVKNTNSQLVEIEELLKIENNMIKVQNEIDEQNHQLEMMEGILQLLSIKMDTLKNSDMQTYDEIVILQNNILNCKINSICESSLKEMAHEICSKLEITSFGDYCTSFYADVYGHEFK